MNRRVGQVELEHTDSGLLRTREEWLVDLDNLRPGLPAVVRVRVQTSQASHDLATRGFDRLVFGTLGESRAVIGEHDVPGQVADPQPDHVVVTDGSIRDPSQRVEDRPAAEATVEWRGAEQRFDRGLRHQLRF